MTDRPSPDEIDVLFREFRRTSSRSARSRLVDAHIGFAYHIAKRYSGRGIPDEDIRQLALLALVKAVDRFDPEVGAAFTSFAGRTIEGEIKRHFRDAGWSVRVPRSTKNRHLQVRNVRAELTQSLGRAPTVREVANHIGVSTDVIVEALGAAAAFSTTTLESGPADEDHSDRSARLADRDEELDSTADRVYVDRLIAELPEREQQIIRLRFFEDRTQSEIAETVGVSQMHVSRLLRRSLALMRRRAGDEE